MACVLFSQGKAQMNYLQDIHGMLKSLENMELKN
jgi:hypothetical protein